MAKVDAGKIKEKYEKARADYLEHQKRERQKRKKLRAKEATERKMVAGEFVLYLLENGEYDRDRFMARLDQYLDNDRRRALFGLEPREKSPDTSEQGASLSPVEQGSSES